MQILDLSSKPRVRSVRYWSAKIDQLYHPLGNFGQDSQDIVYSRDSINTTKFVPILLKEWFYLLKKDGYLIIDYKPNKTCDLQKLEENMWWLWNGKYDIVYHGQIKQSGLRGLTGKKLVDFIENSPPQPTMPKVSDGYFRFVCRKLVTTKVAGDDINHWTFGIITKGERDDWLEEIIQSIHMQRVPHYEIIVCGTYYDRKEKNFIYIPFSERDDKGWITKKKNLMARAARYENFCFLHDRVVLEKNWFAGMKKYGNCFELLTNEQILRGKGYRAGDWLTFGGPLGTLSKISQLDYEDWDYYLYMSGQLSIWKKSIWEKCPWNETLYWGEEDVELSFRTRDLGYLIRFNPYSFCTAFTWRYGKLPSKYYLSEGLLPRDMLLRRLARILWRVFMDIPGTKRFLLPLFNEPFQKFMKSTIYDFLAHH